MEGFGYLSATATEYLLKLTWSTLLLLTAFSNCCRGDVSFKRGRWDHRKLLEIALFSEATQRIHNKGYSDFLDGKDSRFWLISGAHRYLSVAPNNQKKLDFFKEHPKLAEIYKKSLQAESDRKSNHRFFWLVHRMLSFTDFDLENIQTPDECLNENLFLPYDNMGDYICSYLKKNNKR